MFNIDHLVTGNNDTLKVVLTCIRPDMEIRYTTDGNEPVATSSLYTDSLVVTNDITINAATFANGKQMGKTPDPPAPLEQGHRPPRSGWKQSDISPDQRITGQQQTIRLRMVRLVRRRCNLYDRPGKNGGNE